MAIRSHCLGRLGLGGLGLGGLGLGGLGLGGLGLGGLGQSARKILPLTLGLLVLAGCGFQLRNSGFNLDIDKVSVTAANRYGEFSRALERQIVDQGIDVIRPGLADFTIHVLSEHSSKRPVAASSNITTSEYELRLTSRFEVVHRSGEVIISDTPLFVERRYQFNRSSLVGSAEEETLLKQEMRRDLARQLMRRFGAALRKRRGPPPTSAP